MLQVPQEKNEGVRNINLWNKCRLSCFILPELHKWTIHSFILLGNKVKDLYYAYVNATQVQMYKAVTSTCWIFCQYIWTLKWDNQLESSSPGATFLIFTWSDLFVTEHKRTNRGTLNSQQTWQLIKIGSSTNLQVGETFMWDNSANLLTVKLCSSKKLCRSNAHLGIYVKFVGRRINSWIKYVHYLHKHNCAFQSYCWCSHTLQNVQGNLRFAGNLIRQGFFTVKSVKH